ncbi:MAG: hypothetical protein ACRDGN_14325 [bacterium]
MRTVGRGALAGLVGGLLSTVVMVRVGQLPVIAGLIGSLGGGGLEPGKRGVHASVGASSSSRSVASLSWRTGKNPPPGTTFTVMQA